jgi:hypothetical protein
VVKQYDIRSIPHVNIYNRSGRLVGTVVGADAQEIKRYVAQAKNQRLSGQPRKRSRELIVET